MSEKYKSDLGPDTIRMEIELTESPSNTILLGPVLATAAIDDGRRLEIIGSGKLMRLALYNIETGKRIKSYDLDIEPIAAAVVHR